MTLANAFPATESRDMPRLFPQIDLSPFFLWMVKMLEYFQSCGKVFCAHIIWMSWWRFLVSRYPPFFRASVGIPSGPADLLSLRLRTAARTSENLGGSSSLCADGSFGRRCRNAGSVGLFWLRRVLKCSVQCSSIPCLSLCSIVPSVDLIGVILCFWGPYSGFIA